MRHLPLSRYRTMAWKNGGGLTHEIATHSDATGLIWRLSLADVSSDGAYSLFPGYSRLLTVISGSGTRLLDADSHTAYDALPLIPVSFSGDQVIDAALLDGPIQNFNVIFDASRVQASVRLMEPGRKTEIPLAAPTAFFCLGTDMEVSDLESPGARPLTLQTHDTCIASPPARRPGRIRATGRGLCVTLASVDSGT